MKVGLIGAGIMGHGVGLNLLRAEHDLVVIAHRNRASIDDLVSRGATEASSIPELAHGADAVVLCVTDSPTVRSVIEKLLDALSADALLIDLTTNDADAPAEFAAAVSRVGAHYIEAPLTGGAAQAREGVLGAIVGCDAAQFQRARDLLSAFCKKVEHFGPPGMGARAKLVSNFLALGTATLVIETFRQARALGVDWRKLYELVQLGSGNSAGLRRIMDKALEDDFAGYVFSVGNTAKDLSYFCRMMECEDTVSDLARVLRTIHERAVSEGHGDRMLSELLNPEVQGKR
jgi:3-hydroxyisobutyrate dehydrogenase-like beta-hydroxyacid dehydrogenase